VISIFLKSLTAMLLINANTKSQAYSLWQCGYCQNAADRDTVYSQ